MMLASLLSRLVSQVIIGEDKLIEGIALDSRQVKENYLFFAVKGELQDGHLYIEKAIANGAVAIVLENEKFIQPSALVSYVVVDVLKKELGNIAARFYGNASQDMCVFGVTGTNGKTSITHYIAELLQSLGGDCAVIGTLGIEYKDKKVPTCNTTPDAITLQENLYRIRQENIAHVAMEVSSHALEQYRCEGVCFNTAVISNITHDHLDYHGNFSAYEQAKLKLFLHPEISLAIINADDASADKIYGLVSPAVKVVSYSAINKKANVYLSDLRANPAGYQAQLHYFEEQYQFNVNLLGYFNLYNILAAVIAVVEHGYALTEVLCAAALIRPVPGRMQLVHNEHNIVAVVDYAHTPDALENVLKSLRQQVTGKIVVVFGCGGDRDKEKRPQMAAIAEKNADYVIITADNPRTELLEKILDNIVSGMSGKQYSVVPDRESAIAFAVDKVAANDCILVAGKGHEKTQIIGNVIKPFDDVHILAQALAKKGAAIC